MAYEIVEPLPGESGKQCIMRTLKEAADEARREPVSSVQMMRVNKSEFDRKSTEHKLTIMDGADFPDARLLEVKWPNGWTEYFVPDAEQIKEYDVGDFIIGGPA